MEASSKGKVKGSVAANYFKAGAHWSILFVLGVSFLIVQLLASAADYWVSIWTRQEEMRVYNRNHSATSFSDENSTDAATPLEEQPANSYPSFTFSTEFCIYVHAAIMGSLFIFAITRYECVKIHFLLLFHTNIAPQKYFFIKLVWTVFRSIGFYSICVRASQNLHNAMFDGIISTTMRFFDTNPGGRILNRFSKDIG